MKPFIRFWAVFFIFCSQCGWAVAAGQSTPGVKPLYSYFGLVAGEEGEPGYRNGEFYQALFNHPSGLALSPDEKRLYVADTSNHCLRVIALDQDNGVSALAGSTTPGYKDGPVSQAQFSGPAVLTMISNDKLAVYDTGNSALRLVDLKKNMVTTLLGGEQKPGAVRDASFLPVTLSGVWDMSYVSSENALYLSEPDAGVLQKLDLKAGKSSFVLNKDPRIPAPGSFCFSQGRLFVADRKNSALYSIAFGPQGVSGDPLNLLGPSTCQIASLQEAGGAVYAIPFNSDVFLKVEPSATSAVPVTMVSRDGQEVQNRDQDLWFLHSNSEKISFVPMKSEDRRFLLANPENNAIYQFADYGFDKLGSVFRDSPNGLKDYDYPLVKPAGTYRLLLVGVSYLFFETNVEKKLWGEGFNRMETFPKRLEEALNLRASLEGVPIHFQVLVSAHEVDSNRPGFLWPYYLLPDLVKKFDIDQVLYMAVPTMISSIEAYYQRPLGSEGIPVSQMDPEYLLKPYPEKGIQGLPEKFFELCQAKDLAHLGSDGQPNFRQMEDLLAPADVRALIAEMYAKPFGLLADKLKAARTSTGGPVDFRICFFPLSIRPVERYEDFWSRVSRQANIPLLDLKGPLFATKSSYFPVSDRDFQHFTTNGHLYAAQILAQELVQLGVIPWKTGR